MSYQPSMLALQKLSSHATTMQGSGDEFNNYYNLCSLSNQHNNIIRQVKVWNTQQLGQRLLQEVGEFMSL